MNQHFPLNYWIGHRRQDYKRGSLPKAQIEELNSLGFIWDEVEYRWEKALSLLRRFVEREGHANVPQNHKEDGFGLGVWVSTRRRTFKKGTLAKAQIEELNSFGFIWDIRTYEWQQGLKYLRRFIKREGHALVHIDHKEEGFGIGTWVHTRRRAARLGRLSKENKSELNSLGFVWDVNEYRRTINKSS